MNTYKYLGITINIVSKQRLWTEKRIQMVNRIFNTLQNNGLLEYKKHKLPICTTMYFPYKDDFRVLPHEDKNWILTKRQQNAASSVEHVGQEKFLTIYTIINKYGFEHLVRTEEEKQIEKMWEARRNKRGKPRQMWETDKKNISWSRSILHEYFSRLHEVEKFFVERQD